MPPEPLDFDELHHAARSGVDPDEEIRQDIRRYRETFALSADERIVEALLRDYNAERHDGGMWDTQDERRREADRERQLRPFEQQVDAYVAPGAPGAADFAGLWWGWEGGKHLNVAFAHDAELHRSAIGSDVVLIHAARYTYIELEAVVEGISDEVDWLEAAGLVVNEFGIDERANRIELAGIASNEAAARALLRKRYGDPVSFRWDGAEDEVIQPQPWGAWAVNETGRLLTVWYAANSVGRPLEPEVEESSVEVRISARDAMPNGAVTLMGSVHSATAALAEPLAVLPLDLLNAGDGCSSVG